MMQFNKYSVLSCYNEMLLSVLPKNIFDTVNMILIYMENVTRVTYDVGIRNILIGELAKNIKQGFNIIGQLVKI